MRIAADEVFCCHGTPASDLQYRRPAGWQVELRCVPCEHEAAALALAHGRPDWADALRTGFVGRTAYATR